MRTDDVFNDIDSRTADRLAKEYPVLRDEQKERLYAMSKRKFDIKIDNSSIDVSGVEKYRRPRWFKGVSVAAAALLLVSGIGGSIYYISRSGWRASVEIVGTLAETTEVTTEAITEEQTEAEEADADAIAKGLIDDYREFMYTLHAGDLEVDKSDIITKTMKTEDGQYEYQLEFYRVTDQRYPTWADIEKRCLEILDNELGHKVLEICSDIDEDIKKHTFVLTTDNGYYIEKGLHDIGVETLKWEGYDLNSEFDENGNIIAAIRHTHQIESQDFTLETTFTIVNTENGWRISDVTEKPLDDSIEDSTDADAIAKELTGAYRDFVNDLQGGGLKVDKSSVVTKNRMLINDEIHKDFYRVTDPRYSTWADIEKRCFEIFDTDLGQEILDFISFHDEEHMSQNSYIYTSDNGYYIETSIIDCDNGTIEWDEYTAKEEFDENGNIIATIIDKYSQSFSGSDSIIEFTFTIVNTENGWRISDVTEKPLDDSIEDSTDAE